MQSWIKYHLKGDPYIWSIVILLSTVSTLLVYSSIGSLAYRQMHGNTEYYLIKHFSLIILSLFMMWIVHNIDFIYFKGLSKLGLLISIPLLLFTWKYGSNINEASRWIKIPLLNKTFQPSDLAQFCLIGFISNFLSKKQKHLLNFKVFLKLIFWITIVCLLIAMTNLSASILLFCVCMIILFIGGIPFKYLIFFLCIGFITLMITVGIGQRGKTAKNRIYSFYKGKISFQSRQSYIAIASGGLYGKGPGKSIQKNFLPHPYSDFIFAIVAEEYGLLGCIFVIFVYLLFFFRSIQLLNETISLFGSLMNLGLSLMIISQAILNMSVAVGLVPVTGLTLPFLSWGGTSLLFTGITIGAILSISRGPKNLICSKNKTIANNFKKNINNTDF